MNEHLQGSAVMIRVEFRPMDCRVEAEQGMSLLECARQAGLDLVSMCGGEGTCGRCKVQVLQGQASVPNSLERASLTAEELAAGCRLACQVYPVSDCCVQIPEESLTTLQRTQIEGLVMNTLPEPLIDAYLVHLTPPTLDDLRDDARRLSDALQEQHGVSVAELGLHALREVSPRLREEQWAVQAWLRGDGLLAVKPQSASRLGLAVDLGTTKIAGYLVDLADGRTLGARGVMNPQISHGEDVIARIAHARESPSEAACLQDLVVTALNSLCTSLCADAGVEPGDVAEAVVVGNTAMHHLLLRLPVEQLAFSPYVPAVTTALDVKACELGLAIASGGYVHLLPNVAGFVGADHVAVLLATDIEHADGLSLVLDIGTNTEVCLANSGSLTSTSCASGPAFEGAHIQHGMRASQGAIEHLRFVDDQIQYQTVDGFAPAGICGSGIVDAVAQLCRIGVLDRKGKMADHPRVRLNGGTREFVLVDHKESQGGRDVTLTERDVEAVQLAKGAIRAGIQMLLEGLGSPENEIDRVIIAGAFGTYLDVDSAVSIGMFPSLPLDRFHQVGNAAGSGARMALVSRSKRAMAQALARKVGYIELATAPRFMHVFAQAMYLDQVLD
jgi:uncharacterized 2Fe-2S/4Fe-4S cluster protein (DUF4445 family)